MMNAILEDTLLLHEGPRCHVAIEPKGLSYRRLDSGECETVAWSDVVGCQCMKDKRRRHPSHKAFLCFYWYPLKRKCLGRKVIRTRTSLIFCLDRYSTAQENMQMAEQWKIAAVGALRTAVGVIDLLPAPRKLLVFVNPSSGPGKALRIFQQRVVPVLAEAEVEYRLLITEKANHAREFMATEPLDEWDGVVVVSGDGLLFEVFNGIMEREDWKKAIKIPIGVVPGGSGNGLARAIGHALKEPYVENMVLTSTLNLISGRTHPMDLVRIERTNSNVYSFLSIGWGLLSDIDIESEKLRVFGELRFTIWSLARIVGLRSYKGRVSYLPAEDSKENSHKAQAQCLQTERGDVGCHLVSSEIPPLSAPVSSNWTVLEDDFLLVYVAYQSHIGSEVFFAPLAQLDDGIMWLLIARKGITRPQLVSFMLALESGDHTNCPFIDMIAVKAVRIEPFTNKGYMTVDGEVVDHGPLQASVLPSVARVMIR